MALGLEPNMFAIFLSLALVQGKTLPEFSLVLDGSISYRNVPQIQVEFSGGAVDRMILWNHFFNEEDRLAPKTGSKNIKSCKGFNSNTLIFYSIAQDAIILDSWKMTWMLVWPSQAVLDQRMLKLP